MAPLVKTTIQLLLSYLNVLNPQSILKGKSPNAAALAHPGAPSLSAISLGPESIFVFGVDQETGQAFVKRWADNKWYPEGPTMQLLGGRPFAPPTPVSSNKNVMDIFLFDKELHQKSWNGYNWIPASPDQWTNLGADEVLVAGRLAGTSAAPGHLEIFGVDIDVRHLQRKSFNGTDWLPSNDKLDDLGAGGGYLSGSPVALCSPSGEHTVLAVTSEDVVWGTYPEDSTSQWWSTDIVSGGSDPAATSWGEDRLDVFVVDGTGALEYAYSDGGRFSYDKFSGHNTPEFVGTPATTSFIGPDQENGRIDLFVLGADGQYYHNYGHSESENWAGWTSHGGKFSSAPEIVSPENDATKRLDIFGVTLENELVHQMWDGQAWIPDLDQWEKLAGKVKALSINKRVSIDEEL